MNHPLDCPVWTALTTRQSSVAQVAGGIRRFDPVFSPFVATADGSTESLSNLAELVPVGGQVYLQQVEEVPPPSGFVVTFSARTVQMVALDIEGPQADFAFEVLTNNAAVEMLALATLTKPGPFAERTNELGRFLGVFQEHRLIAMAGERMKPGNFTEISGVCTHPDHRGRGYAAGLMREVGRAILTRGEMPFLHALASNHGAIALYEKLGFVTRWEPMLMVWKRV
jgi:ribosomal protein S18 acetylase RimI-like enzyme